MVKQHDITCYFKQRRDFYIKIKAQNEMLVKVMDSDHHLNFHSKAIGTYSTAAPQAILRGNPPTIGIIPKFKKVQSNASRKAGILDFKIEGDRISDGNVS